MKQRIKALFASSVFALALFGAAMAGPLEDGEAAYKNGDYAAAMPIFLSFANYAHVQVNLGYMYYNGQGTRQDYTQALVWFHKAADQGDESGQFMLGLMYDDGTGVPQDYTQAVAWYRRAANQGNTEAQVNLGVMYAKGQGVPQDHVLAHMWFNLSASSWENFDPKDREKAVKDREATAAHMTPDQIAEAQRLAREWKPTRELKPK